MDNSTGSMRLCCVNRQKTGGGEGLRDIRIVMQKSTTAEREREREREREHEEALKETERDKKEETMQLQKKDR